MQTQFQEFKIYLETERQHLSDELESKLTQGSVDSHEGSPFGKREETATESFEVEQRFALARSIRQRLDNVQYALEKLQKGTYGLCDSCRQPIPLARLQAMPQANLCMACKSRQRR